ncbi:glycosyltransferase [Allochromatium humboldtianum]|jgi:1,2-diacylglycerol 3-alpha-glucosyltransferase|uniref:Glycosyltransferase n=1 Tax=Allochromatium humboldtianum TaxID=504901 RepID=A0A850RDN1_9GAMM|nr:glycosyltransferase [Allochromatium humboldtianum]NVZ07801.1 glycosyltransferase [Allochromatium humboldtianum]
MRVLMISDVYFPRVTGVSTSIQTFAREFGAKGHEVTLIAPDYGSSDYDSKLNESFEIIRIPSRYLPIDPEDRILQPFRIRGLTDALKGRGFDLLHIQTPFIAHYSGLGLARRLELPVVESYHTFFEQYLHHYVPWVPARWMRGAARHFSTSQCNGVDALVAPSRAMLDVLRDYGIQTPAEVIPTGIDLDQFSQGDGRRFRARHDIPPERPVLVLVSRLAFEKNIEFILRALVRIKAEVPDVLLVIAGEGPAQRDLERLAEQLGLADNTRFLGYLNRDGSLEDCYRAGTAFLFASRTETQGLVLLEAMALGVPVVSTAVMGTKEVLGDGQGALIAEEDEADFAGKAVRLLKEPDLRRRLAREAVEHAHDWSAPVLADRLLKFYEQVIDQARISIR